MINLELFELLGEIDENKISDAENVKKGKSSTWIKFVAAVACFVLVAVASLPIINRFTPNVNDVTPSPVEYSTLQSGEQIHLPCIRATHLIVNQADAVICADMAVEVDYYDNIVDLTDSLDSLKNKIPSSWELKKVYSISLADEKEKHKFHDLVYLYTTDLGGSVKISVCSFEEPVKDTILHCEEPVTSQINRVDVIACGYENMYTARFKYDNVYYYILTEDVELGEFDGLISSITLNSDKPIGDPPADICGDYYEAIEADDLSGKIKDIFGGSYIDEKGRFTVVLTEDTKENRASILNELKLDKNNTVFKKGEYTLDYLTKIQSKISNAMMNKELPFVVSSGVYEMENSVKVGVITNDKKELEKIKAFDSIGGAIEIEFSSSGTHDLYLGR